MQTLRVALLVTVVMVIGGGKLYALGFFEETDLCDVKPDC